MVDMNIVNDNIGYILERNATTAHNVHISPTSIKSLVAIENEFLGKLNKHITWKHNPQGLYLYHCIS